MTCPGIEFGDPCLPHLDAHKNDDPERTAIAALYEHCREIDENNGDYEGSWWPAQHIYSEIETGVHNIEAFRFFLDHYFDKDGINRRATGKLIRRWNNRTVNGIVMEIDERDSKSTRHTVRFRKKSC